MSFKERLKLLRQEFSLNQKEFAERFGISQSRYNQWESGKNRPDYETLILLANYFNTTVDYLIGRTDKRYIDKMDINLPDWQNEILAKNRNLLINVFNRYSKLNINYLDKTFQLAMKGSIEFCILEFNKFIEFLESANTDGEEVFNAFNTFYSKISIFINNAGIDSFRYISKVTDEIEKYYPNYKKYCEEMQEKYDNF